MIVILTIELYISNLVFFSSYLSVPQYTIQHWCYCSTFINNNNNNNNNVAHQLSEGQVWKRMMDFHSIDKCDQSSSQLGWHLLSASLLLGFLDRNWHHKSVAIQIIHDSVLYRYHTLAKISPSAGTKSNIQPSIVWVHRIVP